MDSKVCFFYLSDLKRLILEKKYLLIFLFLAIFIITSFLILIKEPKYEAKASFFEDSEKSQTIGNLKDIILTDNYSPSSDAFSFLKTKTINKKLVEKLGLQISVLEENYKCEKLERIIYKNLKLFFSKKIDDDEVIEFSNVFYEKSTPSYFNINFLDKSSFEVYDVKMNLLGKKAISQVVNLKDLSFIIDFVPNKYIKKTIQIKIEPWITQVNDLLKNIEITKEKNSSNFLNLKIKYPHKETSIKILNTLMDMYHQHLVFESDDFIKNQITYLEKRRSDLENNLFSLIDKNENQLSLNAKTNGFVDLNTEVDTLLNKRETYQKKLEEISRQLDLLKNVNLIDIDKNICVDDNILKIIDEIKRFQEKKQAIQLSINKDLSLKKDLALDEKKDLELNNIINEKNHLSYFKRKNFEQNYLANLQNVFDIQNNNRLVDIFNEKKELTNNIENKNSSVSTGNINILDLNLIKDFQFQLDKSKDDLKLEISQLRHILKKINLKNFQISSISIFLSPDLVKNIIDISKKIKDFQNYTSKEIEVLQHEYDLEKKYIINHLEELLNLKKLNFKLINEKLFSLKKIQLNLISNEISFLSNKAKDLISRDVYEKKSEKKLLEENLNEIKNNLQNLISKITQENKLNMKSQMTQNMIESLTKLIESKKIDLNLKKINSRPVDLATANIISIHLLRNSFIVAFLGVFIFLIIYIYIAILRGFPISKEVLEALSLDYCGIISSKCHGIEVKNLKPDDLEALRKIISGLNEQNKIITSIASNGPNFVHYLAALLSVMGKNVLVIETKSEIDEKNGLFSFLDNDDKKFPIQKIQAYDFLPSGEKKYFAFELLKSFKFFEKLEQIKSKYDLILIYSDAKINSAEARVYLEFSDKVILTFKKETLEDIKLFINWDKEKKKLCFVTY